MVFQKLRQQLQAALLTCAVATSFVYSAAAQTPADVARAGKVISNRTPASALPNDQLLRQRRILAKIVYGRTGTPKLRRNAELKMRFIDFELRKRKIPVPGKPRKVRVPNVGQPANNQNVAVQNQAALQVLADRRPSRSLSVKQLRQRIRVLRDIIVGRKVGKKLLIKARDIRNADLAELRKRSGVIASPQLFAVLKDRRPAASLPTPQLRQRIRKLAQVIAVTANQPKKRSRARDMHAADIKELKKRSSVSRPANNANTAKVIAALSDRRPPRSLSRRQLKQRIDTLAGLVSARGINARQRKTLKNLYNRDVAELNRRRASAPRPGGGVSGGGAGNAGNYAVLQDLRAPSRLSMADLRRRVNVLRNILRRRDIPSRTRVKLAKKLVADRTELRRRIAERRARNAGENLQPPVTAQPRIKASEQARRLLSDYRASAALNKRQLNARIRGARNVLKFVALNPAQRTRLANMIKLDRAEKRRRLIAARDRRRIKLERQRARGELRIEINPRVVLQPYDNREHNDLAAAEADEGMIERQFLEPTPKRFERRYSREEIVRRPDLTRGFAGIDVDTVNFGFNEYWIREEEIDELERMAVTIEKILAARPYEVFQIEGHTDAVGSDAYNLKLSRQRAEAVKDALTRFFVIPSRALVTVGLGERYLKIPTLEAESENRRVTIRRITPIVAR